MFGMMNAVPVLNLRDEPASIADCPDQAVARLLELTERPKIEQWIEFPKAVFVFLVVAGDAESGAFYVYDRLSKVWYWVDFDDDKFGGYTAADFNQLVRECHFLDIVECPQLLARQDSWVVKPGLRPRCGNIAGAKQRVA
jgi:hypothetical protein